ncbi:MAG: hypothetical protein ACE5FF_03240 [Saprospiraceae bacterium]
MLVANEVIQSRVHALRMNLDKWGYPNTALTNHDSADFGKLTGFFDVLLVDAPCSGEGLFRKSPAAAGEWLEANTGLCVARQGRILANAIPLLKPGGLLIYATCTFNPAENSRNVEQLLHGGTFDICDIKTEKSWGVEVRDLGYQFYPHKVKGEGFFMACLRKRGVEAPVTIQKNVNFDGWRRLRSKERNLLHSWISELDALEIFEKPNGELVAFHADLLPDYQHLALALRKRAFGTSIGKLKRTNFIPSHALALSGWVPGIVPFVELEKEQALRFLRKETLALEQAPKGWCLARFESTIIFPRIGVSGCRFCLKKDHPLRWSWKW